MKYGNVIEKWHEPERHYMMLMPMTISNGKTTTTMMIPYYIHDNEDWCIKSNCLPPGNEREKEDTAHNE